MRSNRHERQKAHHTYTESETEISDSTRTSENSKP